MPIRIRAICLCFEDNRIAPVDFGMMGKLSHGSLELVADLLMAATSDDTRRIWCECCKITNCLMMKFVRRRSEADLALFLHRYHGIPLAKLNMRSLIWRCFRDHDHVSGQISAGTDDARQSTGHLRGSGATTLIRSMTLSLNCFPRSRNSRRASSLRTAFSATYRPT